MNSLCNLNAKTASLSLFGTALLLLKLASFDLLYTLGSAIMVSLVTSTDRPFTVLLALINGTVFISVLVYINSRKRFH